MNPHLSFHTFFFAKTNRHRDISDDVQRGASGVAAGRAWRLPGGGGDSAAGERQGQVARLQRPSHLRQMAAQVCEPSLSATCARAHTPLALSLAHILRAGWEWVGGRDRLSLSITLLRPSPPLRRA